MELLRDIDGKFALSAAKMISDYRVFVGFMEIENPGNGKKFDGNFGKRIPNLWNEVVVLGYGANPGNKTCQRLWVY